MNNNYLYDPENKFKYVGNNTLWNNIFVNPFPRDLNNPEDGQLILDNYFFIKELIEWAYNGDENERWFIGPREKFYSINEHERNAAFKTLCQFLIYYRRPCTDCVISIPRNPSVERDPEFSPLVVSYRDPIYPDIVSEKNKLRIEFDQSTYDEVARYYFGPDAKIYYETRTLLFSFDCFAGFILHH